MADRRLRDVPPVAVSSGSSSCRRLACSSGEAFRQISASPATLNTSGHAQWVSQPALNTPATSSTRMSSDPRPIASRMPRESYLALLAMLASAPAAGMKSQAAMYSGTKYPADTKAAITNTIRTVVTLKPRHSATPAATPPRQPVGRVTAQRAAITAPLP